MSGYRESCTCERCVLHRLVYVEINGVQKKLEAKFEELTAARDQSLAEIAALTKQLQESRAVEAMCHCGALFSSHGHTDDHSPVEMVHPCPHEQALAGLKAERDKFRDILAEQRDKAIGYVKYLLKKCSGGPVYPQRDFADEEMMESIEAFIRAEGAKERA